MRIRIRANSFLYGAGSYRLPGTGFWSGFLLKELHEEAESFLRRYEAMSQMSLEEGIPPFAEMFESDARRAKRLLHAGTYEEMREALSEIREKGAFMR